MMQWASGSMGPPVDWVARKQENDMHDLYSLPRVEPEDYHRRTANEIETERMIVARTNVLARLRPFVLLADQNLSPAEFLETIGKRLFAEAREIRLTMPAERVVSLNVHGERVVPIPDRFDFHQL